jgi:mRNA interferase RelE/StbE
MNETVTISRQEYERLLAAAEDLADVAAYDRAKADLAAGREELITSEFAARLLAGESPLKVYREWRGLNQTGLARLSGVNRVQIADIEAERRSGSAETLRKLAQALGILVDDLI